MDPNNCSVNNSDDTIVITSNKSRASNSASARNIASALRQGVPRVLAFANTHAIADTGATSIFVMAGTPMKNIHSTMDPLTINLPNGEIVHSTHICDISIPGLPMILTGHIVPGLSMASLMGIRVLCKAGCKVIFTDMKCEVRCKNKDILNGIKDPTTDLWTLPITPMAINETGCHDLGKDQCNQKNPHPFAWAAFPHSVRTRANAVKFSHQSLCNPTISSLMKALKKGFLKGCPDLSEELVTKYLNPSPATAQQRSPSKQ